MGVVWCRAMFDFHAAILFVLSLCPHRAKVTIDSVSNLPPVMALICQNRDQGNAQSWNKSSYSHQPQSASQLVKDEGNSCCFLVAGSMTTCLVVTIADPNNLLDG